jgi:hypothetical protein
MLDFLMTLVNIWANNSECVNQINIKLVKADLIAWNCLVRRVVYQLFVFNNIIG